MGLLGAREKKIENVSGLYLGQQVEMECKQNKKRYKEI